MACAQAVTRLLAGAGRWEVRSAGHGAKGQRWYAWALLATASPRHHLLAAGHSTRGGEPAMMRLWMTHSRRCRSPAAA